MRRVCSISTTHTRRWHCIGTRVRLKSQRRAVQAAHNSIFSSVSAVVLGPRRVRRVNPRVFSRGRKIITRALSQIHVLSIQRRRTCVLPSLWSIFLSVGCELRPMMADEWSPSLKPVGRTCANRCRQPGKLAYSGVTSQRWSSGHLLCVERCVGEWVSRV